jgi:hypothetical protein
MTDDAAIETEHRADPKKKSQNSKNYTVHDSELITAARTKVPVAFQLSVEIDGASTIIGKLISVDRYALKMELLEAENDEDSNDVWIGYGQTPWIQKRYIVISEILDGHTIKSG